MKDMDNTLSYGITNQAKRMSGFKRHPFCIYLILIVIEVILDIDYCHVFVQLLKVISDKDTIRVESIMISDKKIC